MNTYIFILFFLFFSLSSSKAINSILYTDKLYLVAGKDIFLVNLVQNEITEELITILPIKTRLSEKNSTEKLKYISLKTQIEMPISFSSGLINAKKGEIVLYKGKKLIIINEDTNFYNENNNDFIIIGFIENVEKFLSSISLNKSIYIWNTLNYENQKEKVRPYGYYTSLMNFFTWKIFTFICFILL